MTVAVTKELAARLAVQYRHVRNDDDLLNCLDAATGGELDFTQVGLLIDWVREEQQLITEREKKNAGQ